MSGDSDRGHRSLGAHIRLRQNRVVAQQTSRRFAIRVLVEMPFAMFSGCDRRRRG
jgi:hypothetical protein